jgi:hypothetical protein
MDPNKLRELIKNIRSDLTLNESDKNLKIQELMMGTSKSLLENKSNESKVCSHYQKRNYHFKFNCCGIYDPCRRCHIERKSCEPDKITVSEITCSECEKTQEPSESCVECGIKFSNSYCKICCIWSEKEITHCEGCGICRAGNQSEIFHCYTCETCFSLKNSITNEPVQHICFEKSCSSNTTNKRIKISCKDASCAICDESIFNAQISSFPLDCGHFIHRNCYQKMIQHDYKCPTCKKSVCNMTTHWNKIRRMIKTHPLPHGMIPINQDDIVDSPWGKFLITGTKFIDENLFYIGEFVNWNVSKSTQIKATGILNSNSVRKNLDKEIYCNDCEKKSITQFHFYGLECKECGSFNTQK